MKKHAFAVRRSFPRLVLAALLASAAAGCAAPSTAPPAAVTTARLDFMQIEPLPVLVNAVQVISTYNPAASPADQSSYFPVPPELALRRYAEARFKPAGLSHILKFVIEDASVRHDLVGSGHKIGDWMGVGRSEMYEISIALRLYTESAHGAVDGTPPATLTFRRSTHIPAGYSIEQREAEQLRFLEEFILDIDKAVTATLQQKMRLAGKFLSPADGMFPEGAAIMADATQPEAAVPVSVVIEESAPAVAPAPVMMESATAEPAVDAKPEEPPVTPDSRLLAVHTLLSAPATAKDENLPQP